MNTRLEKLFEKYDFTAKDKYDFLQIYELLPPHKKIKAQENFDEIASKLTQLRNDLKGEQEILFGEALMSIEQKLAQIGKSRVVSESKGYIDSLKKTL